MAATQTGAKVVSYMLTRSANDYSGKEYREIRLKNMNHNVLNTSDLATLKTAYNGFVSALENILDDGNNYSHQIRIINFYNIQD